MENVAPVGVAALARAWPAARGASVATDAPALAGHARRPRGRAGAKRPGGELRADAVTRTAAE